MGNEHETRRDDLKRVNEASERVRSLSHLLREKFLRQIKSIRDGEGMTPKGEFDAPQRECE